MFQKFFAFQLLAFTSACGSALSSLATLTSVAFAISGFTSVALATTVQAAATQTVIMKSISFDPKVLQVKVGDSVDWENKSYTQHSATSDDSGGFDTGLIDPNQKTKRIDFTKPGSYRYHCSVHGKTMSGVIVVNEK